MSHSISLTAARTALAAIFLWSGFGKLTGLEATAAYIEASGLPFPLLAAVGAACLELGAGAMLAIGFCTFYAAGLLAVFSVGTAVIFHNTFSDENQLIHFLKNIAIAGGLAHVALAQRARA